MIVLIDQRKVAENFGSCIGANVPRDILGHCGVLGLNGWPGLFKR